MDNKVKLAISLENFFQGDEDNVVFYSKDVGKMVPYTKSANIAKKRTFCIKTKDVAGCLNKITTQYLKNKDANDFVKRSLLNNKVAVYADCSVIIFEDIYFYALFLYLKRTEDARVYIPPKNALVKGYLFGGHEGGDIESYPDLFEKQSDNTYAPTEKTKNLVEREYGLYLSYIYRNGWYSIDVVEAEELQYNLDSFAFDGGFLYIDEDFYKNLGNDSPKDILRANLGLYNTFVSFCQYSWRIDFGFEFNYNKGVVFDTHPGTNIFEVLSDSIEECKMCNSKNFLDEKNYIIYPGDSMTKQLLSEEEYEMEPRLQIKRLFEEKGIVVQERMES